MQKETPAQPSKVTVINAAHLITSDANNTVFSPGAIAFDGTTNLATGSPKDVERHVKDHISGGPENNPQTQLETIQLPDHAILPGLINSHAHSAMALFRGLADDLPLMTWLQSHIWPAESQWVSDKFVAAGTRLAMAEMLLSGTTCFTDMYFFPEIAAETALAAGMRAQVACPILDFPTQWGSGPDEYIEKTCNLIHEYNHSKGLIQVGFGPHAPYTVSDAPLTKIAALAHQHDTFIQMHVHETAHEVNEAIETLGQRPLNRLHQLDLLGPHFQAVHFTQATEADIALAAETQLNVIHCPESNLKLASGFTPAQAFLDAGVNVALGTDGAASNNDLDLFGELRTASLLAKSVAQDASAIPAKTALNLATTNAAKALGRAQQLGLLHAGAAADFIAVNLKAPNTQPLYNLQSQIAYALNSQQIEHVWIAGRQVVQDRQLLTLNQADILAEAEHWCAKIQAQAKIQTQ